jgi:CHASE1-domain containing sensor protein
MDVIEHTRRSRGSVPEPGADRTLMRGLERWAAQPAFARGILALTLLLTGLAWWAARIDAQDEARVRFEHQTEDLQHRIAQGMERYELLLRSGVALFVSTDSMNAWTWTG